jgi:hypothetical protein
MGKHYVVLIEVAFRYADFLRRELVELERIKGHSSDGDACSMSYNSCSFRHRDRYHELVHFSRLVAAICWGKLFRW